jgi:2-oxoglutarate ferredoxin oxidoreductase subunit alpha
MHWLTGGEHTKYGRVTEDPVIREQQMEKRARKLELATREIPKDEKFKVYGTPSAAFTITTWGSNKGAILEALELLKAENIAARLIQVRLLWPFPAEEIMPLLERADPLVVVELNYSGQFARLLRESTGRIADHLVVKYNGRPMSGQELYRAFKHIHEGTSEQRIVLRNPYE